MTVHPSCSPSSHSIEIAVLCALPIEYDAICLIFDKIWEENDGSYGHANSQHINKYTTGIIGHLNVVLALSSGRGKVAMDRLTGNLMARFTGVQLLILAGVCAGAPSTEGDILLGDVVISRSLVQYDFGKQLPGGFATVTSLAEYPHRLIRSMVAAFQTDRERDRLVDRATVHLSEIQARAEAKRRVVDYSRPPASEDMLFGSGYLHRHRGDGLECSCSDTTACEAAQAATCKELKCEAAELVRRPRLERVASGQDPAEVEIFVGRFGSADMTVRCGKDRDRLVREHGIMALENEGVGPWDRAPCILVKGVCGFADSHENTRWRSYAAATSAAVTKAILEGWVGVAV